MMIVLPPPSRPHVRRSAGGFTLVELLTTVSIVAILLAVAAPSFVQFQRNSELRQAANELLGAATAARVEAMKRGRPIVVRPARDDDWATGWVMSYTSGSGASATTTTLGRGDAFPASVTVASSNLEGFRFTPSGAPAKLDGSGGFQSGSIVLGNGSETRKVKLAPTGRVTVCNPAQDSSC